MMRVGAYAVVIALSVLSSTAAWAKVDPPAVGFAALKTLVGAWKRADDANSPLRVHFALTAGGSVLTESWTRDGQPHSLTVYHRDGADLIATHYCPQGNQPRLAMVSQVETDLVQFAFRDASDLDVDNEAHVVAISFDLSNDQRLLRQETYRLGGKDEQSELVLVREP